MSRRFAGLILLVVFLSACGQLPRPFARDADPDANPLAQNLYWEGVEVPPLTGTTPPMGKLLAEAVVKQLDNGHQIPAALTGLDRSKYLLEGHVNVERRGVIGLVRYSITWKLTERGGPTIEEYTEDVNASQFEWDYGSPKLIRGIGERIGMRTAQRVLGDRYGTAGQDRLLGRDGVYLAGVRGAPGDGNEALRRAMGVALGGGGLTLVNDPAKALHTVNAEVSVGTAEKGAQPIRIVWSVRDVTGDVIGTAEQANAVPAGSLDGRWGRTAAFVAAAAMDGIIRIVKPTDSTRRFRAPDLGGGSRPAAGPAPRDLPQIPGRAPPPPS